MKKVVNILLLALIVLLPIQTHYEFTHPILQSVPWDFGQVNLYGTDILLILTFAAMTYSGVYRHMSRKLFLPIIIFCLALLFATFIGRRDIMSYYIALRFIEGALLAWMIAVSRIPLRWIISAFAFSMAANALFGLWQFGAQYIPAQKWLGLAAQFPHQEGAAIVATWHARYLRAYGTFPYPNIFGLYLAPAFISGIWLLSQVYTRLRTVPLHIRVYRSLLLLAVTLIGVGTVYTFSRSAWLGITIGMFVLIGLMLIRHLWRQLAVLVVACVVVATSLFILSPSFSLQVKGRVEAREVHEQRSVSDRKQSFSDADALLKDAWITGIGLARFSYEIISMVDPLRQPYQANPVHSMFLLLAVEAGVFSAIALFAVFWFLLTDLFRAFYARMASHSLDPPLLGFALFASLVVMSFFGNYLPTLPSGIFLLFLVLGLCLKTIIEPGPEKI